MITVICYWFWSLWGVEVEDANLIKGMFATFSVFELASELIVLCVFINDVIKFIRKVGQ